jgi:hypothetical protein
MFNENLTSFKKSALLITDFADYYGLQAAEDKHCFWRQVRFLDYLIISDLTRGNEPT